MLTRVDHILLAVHDLAAATETWERLGLRVVFGGEHPRWGTHNALVRFGLDYLELLAVKDRKVAEESGFRVGLLSYLDQGEGWVGYACGVDDAAAAVAELERRGAEVEGPIAGLRKRPDGVLLEWKTIGLPMPLIDRRLPFLIQHLPGDAERLEQLRREGAVGGHPLGARRLRSVTLAVRDLEATARRYAEWFGLSVAGYEQNIWLEARCGRLPLGQEIVVLAEPSAPGSPLNAELELHGEGTCAIELEVEDLDHAIRHLSRNGFSYERAGPGRTVELDPRQLHGGRVALSQA